MKPKDSGTSSKTKGGQQFRRLTAAVSEMKSIRRGERVPSRTWVIAPDGKGGYTRRETTRKKAVRVGKPTLAMDLVLNARRMLKLSQIEFATFLGISPGTLRGWEQGRREPNRAARVLLQVAVRSPQAVIEAASA